MARRALSLLAAALLLGCAALDPTSRAYPYNYTIPLTSGLIFHWPQSSLPVRIWVQGAADLDDVMENAIREWESNAPYGEFRAIVVPDAANADVIVRAGTVRAASAGFPDHA